MTKCALFDFADTLAERKPDRLDVVSKYIERAGGIRVGREAIALAYNSIDLLMPYSSVKIRTKEQRDNFYRQYNMKLLILLGVAHLTNPTELIAAFEAEKAHWQLKPGAWGMLAELRQLGWPIGIISNFDSQLEKVVFDHLSLRDLVDYLHISQTEGIEKPDPLFYQSFFSRYSIDIPSSFYVGDSFVLDFLPARGLGLRAWLLDEAGLYQHLPEAICGLGDVLTRISA